MHWGIMFIASLGVNLADDDLLAAAQKELKTDAAQSARERQIAWLKSGGLEEMADPDQRGGVWR